MADNEVHPSLFNPFFAWTDLAMRTTEMMVSSSQVVGERVDELARAGANPSARDAREFTLASPDTMKAATDASLRIANTLQNASFQLISQAWQQWFSSLAAMTALTGSNSFGEALARQDRLFRSLTQPSRAFTRGGEDSPADATPRPARGTSAAAKRNARVSRTRVTASRR